MRGHLAPVRANAVLPDIDSLPRAERQTASDERYRNVDRRQRSAHVRRHVVVAFLAMTEQRIAVRHEPREEALEVGAHFRVRVLLHEEACRRVAKEQREDTGAHLAGTQPVENWPRDLDEPAAAGLEREHGGGLA